MAQMAKQSHNRLSGCDVIALKTLNEINCVAAAPRIYHWRTDKFVARQTRCLEHGRTRRALVIYRIMLRANTIQHTAPFGLVRNRLCRALHRVCYQTSRLIATSVVRLANGALLQDQSCTRLANKSGHCECISVHGVCLCTALSVCLGTMSPCSMNNWPIKASHWPQGQ